MLRSIPSSKQAGEMPSHGNMFYELYLGEMSLSIALHLIVRRCGLAVKAPV